MSSCGRCSQLAKMLHVVPATLTTTGKPSYFSITQSQLYWDFAFSHVESISCGLGSRIGRGSLVPCWDDTDGFTKT